MRCAGWRGLPFEPEDIALTTGAFGALAAAFRALLDPGDEVIYSLPPWFLYEPMLLAADAVPVKVRVRADDNDLDLDAIAAAIGPRTRAVIVNTPQQPDRPDLPARDSGRAGGPAHLRVGAVRPADLADRRRALRPAGLQRRRVPQPQRVLPVHR